jgi:hypothetical protein
MNIVDLEFLMPGHVFIREDGREARFLFLTNTVLSAKQQKEYPPQVVYADENNNVLSCNIERFLAHRKFLNVDPELEARLQALLLQTSSSEDTLDLDGDDDELLVTGDEDEGENGGELSEGETEAELYAPGSMTVEEASANLADELESLGASLQIVYHPQSELPAVIDPQVLAEATTSYQQSPTLNGALQHELFIRAEDGITQASLYASFSPTHDEKNATYTFSIELEGQQVTVDGDFAGVFPCVFFNDRMYRAIFVTEKAPEAAEPVIIDPPAEAVAAEAEIQTAAEAVNIAAAAQAAPAVTIQPQVAVAAQ